MIRIVFCLAMLAGSNLIFAQGDEEAVKQVVLSAYVGGIHNGGPVEDIRKGFHPSFRMLRLAGNDVSPLPIEDWIANIEKSRREKPGQAATTEAKFLNVTVVGSSASAVLELYREGKKIFTDHLLLYRFEEGWRIVSKTFYRH